MRNLLEFMKTRIFACSRTIARSSIANFFRTNLLGRSWRLDYRLNNYSVLKNTVAGFKTFNHRKIMYSFKCAGWILMEMNSNAFFIKPRVWRVVRISHWAVDFIWLKLPYLVANKGKYLRTFFVFPMQKPTIYERRPTIYERSCEGEFNTWMTENDCEFYILLGFSPECGFILLTSSQYSPKWKITTGGQMKWVQSKVLHTHL